ncbi:pectate lyase [Sorangium cellulosum]|uniref:pectate lyase family protein n=1 Tax=Sorangium cellulosum TaxID=56 RepID=UPI001010FB03|nr:pectate lyase [Sorangium cellulosum]
MQHRPRFTRTMPLGALSLAALMAALSSCGDDTPGSTAGGSSSSGSGGGSSATGGGSSGSGGSSSASGGGSSATSGGSGPSPSTSSASSGGGSSSSGGSGDPGASGDCIDLVTNPEINWRESSLQSDQEIVQCLAETLGRPVGYGERALGGFDPDGNSRLTVITTRSNVSVEQQIYDAVTGDEHNWVVFDKDDFRSDHDIAMYRLKCSEPAVLAKLGATERQCVDYQEWCDAKGVPAADCEYEFFNVAMNDADLPVRNVVIGSNTTIDGRMSRAIFRFSGFAIGRDSTGTPTQTSESVILTHLSFKGAGHVEDHGLDPDMIRSTGASHDIWIHKNSFSFTGDSAFDVKVGAHDITMSFNRVLDVKRATLHGSSDSHTIDTQITTTMHHNAFVTSGSFYDEGRGTARRVPLLRHGSSHMFNNVFVNYYKDFASVRMGGTLLFEDNVFLGGPPIQREKSDPGAAFDEWVTRRLSGNVVDDGSFTTTGSFAWFSDDACVIDPTYKAAVLAGGGAARDLSQDYSEASRARIGMHELGAGQDLVDYVNATAGKDGAVPFNSPLSEGRDAILGLPREACVR